MKITLHYLKAIAILLLFIGIYSCEQSKDEPKPTTPENLAASDEYALKIVVSWDDAENAESFDVYRAVYDFFADPADLSFSLVGNTENTTYEDLSVESSASYYYKIKAVNGSGESEFSDAVVGYTITLTADEAFTALAEYTGGVRYDAGSASEVPDIINTVIDEQASSNTDLVFLIDNTASMSDDISEVKSSLTTIINNLPGGTKLAMAVYNDANEDPTGWYSWFDLTTDYTLAISYLNDITVYGGGDLPESVYDGIYLTVDNLSWSSSSKRMILVIGDAPPLDGDLTTYSLKQVIDKCESMSIDVNLYPVLISAF
jgi:hypothetical protein